MPGPDMATRIAAALERLAPAPLAQPDFAAADAFVWHPQGFRLSPVARVVEVERWSRIPERRWALMDYDP